jgi:transcriptional regulator with XRE-family HTH domain
VSPRKPKKSSGNQEVGQRFRQIRESKGLKQTDLAVLLGYKSSVPISKIELGKQCLSLNDLIELDKSLNVDLHRLITGNPSPGEDELVTNQYELFTRLSLSMALSLNHFLDERDFLKEELASAIERYEKKPTRDEGRFIKELKASISHKDRDIYLMTENDSWARQIRDSLEKRRRK